MRRPAAGAPSAGYPAGPANDPRDGPAKPICAYRAPGRSAGRPPATLADPLAPGWQGRVASGTGCVTRAAGERPTARHARPAKNPRKVQNRVTPAGTVRHRKVALTSTCTAPPLVRKVAGWPSRGRGHWFETSIAHHKVLVRTGAKAPLRRVWRWSGGGRHEPQGGEVGAIARWVATDEQEVGDGGVGADEEGPRWV